MDVLAAVEAAYQRQNPVHWPDPHPEGDRGDDEYSRVTDAEKYRIVGFRVQAWIDATISLGLAVATSTTWKRPHYPAEESVLLLPSASNAVPLTLGFHSLRGVPRTVVDVGAGDPAEPIDLIPDCACDACDSGSDDLLAAIDHVISAIVFGRLIHVVDGDRSATDYGNQCRSIGRGAMDLLTDARAGTSKHRVVRGPAWTRVGT